MIIKFHIPYHYQLMITLRPLIYSIKIQSQLSSYNDVAVVGTVYKSCDQFTDAHIYSY